MKEDQRYRLQKILEHITYKPGWKLEVDFSRRPQPYLEEVVMRVTMMQPDMRTHQPIPIIFFKTFYSSRMENMLDEDIVKHFILQSLRYGEEHELAEWFKYDGFHIIDPHPERNEHAIPSYERGFEGRRL